MEKPISHIFLMSACVHLFRLWPWRTGTSSRWTLLSMTWLKTWPCWRTSTRPLCCSTCVDATLRGWSMWVHPLSHVSMFPSEAWLSRLNYTLSNVNQRRAELLTEALGDASERVNIEVVLVIFIYNIFFKTHVKLDKKKKQITQKATVRSDRAWQDDV